jgi:uncharacterized protein (TIGR03083 family)
MAGSGQAAVLYRDAAVTFAGLIARVEPDADWRAPGLGEWDLRALVGHTCRALITVLDYLDRPVPAETIASPEQYYAQVARQSTDPAAVAERGRQAGEALGPNPQRVVADLVDRVQAKITDADPEAVISVLGGGMRVRNYLPTRTFELVVHSFDIGAATGVDVTFSTEVLTDAAELATRIAVAAGEGRTVLTALTGRGPLPAGFSIVV